MVSLLLFVSLLLLNGFYITIYAVVYLFLFTKLSNLNKNLKSYSAQDNNKLEQLFETTEGLVSSHELL